MAVANTFGAESLTAADRAYVGSRFADVRRAIFANPYLPVWGAPGNPPLPMQTVTLSSVLRGALSFAPLVQRYLDADVPLAASEPFVYAVHRDSQVKYEEFATYLDATHSLVDAAAGRDSYFGIDLRAAPKRLTQAELGRV